MTHYKYIVVGGGMAAHAAVRGIRGVDKDGTVAVFSDEPDAPYKRPPLSKDLWKGKALESIWYDTKSWVIDLSLSCRVKSIDPPAKQIATGGGNHTYDKLVLATGGTPRRLPGDVDGIIYYRTVEDYRLLRAQTDSRERFAVIGGGFIGSEIAAALAMNGKKVVMIFPGATITSRVLPQDLAEFVTGYFREKGVDVIADSKVNSLQCSGDRFELAVPGDDDSERHISADGIVAGIGITPNVDLARDAGLEVTDGIVVDEYLRTSAPDVFAAGDVANFIDATLGVRRRVEHEDNAKTMGRTVGQTMAGQETKYDHLPFFYSDLFDLGYEAVGELDSRLETYSDWQEKFRKGVIYYLRDGRVRGVLLWNVWDQVKAARRLIAEPGPFSAENLKGRLPEPKDD